MTLPRILVVDDQFTRNATERFVFLKDAGLANGKVGSGGTVPPYAEVVFCSGQREEGSRLINDYSVVRDAVAGSDWALVLLDVQFDSGELDTNGRPAGQTGDDFFGITIHELLKQEFSDLPVVMLTGKRQDEIGETDAPYFSKHGLGSYEMHRALLQFGSLDAETTRSLLDLDTRVCADDPATLNVFRQAFIYAHSDASILILGESGVGKEVLADYVHRLSGRAGEGKRFVAVNVAAIPNDLVESELFGIGRRIATGVDARPGKFELASGGTLFLDEIGDMSIEIQAKVLRALQERKIVRVGETEEIPVDIRLVCATSRDLANRVKSGDFRSDLLYRINTVPITMAPLRERRKEIAPLARKFLDNFSNRQGKVGLSFSQEALCLLEAQPFPGNVRELENLVERLISVAGHHQVIGRREMTEILGLGIHPSPQPAATTVAAHVESGLTSSVPSSTPLDQVLDLIKAVSVDKDDPALKGVLPRLDSAVLNLRKRLTGSALERCRNPNTEKFNRQLAIRFLTGDDSIAATDANRIINKIIGRVNQEITDDDLNSLVDLWREGNRNAPRSKER